MVVIVAAPGKPPRAGRRSGAWRPARNATTAVLTAREEKLVHDVSEGSDAQTYEQNAGFHVWSALAESANMST